MKLWKLFSLAIAMVLSTSVNATIVTHGSLITNDDGSSNIITDNLNNVEYLRFNVLAGLNYAETLAALSTQDGGGWAIATAADALGFTRALLGENSTCPNYASSDFTSECGSASGWVDGDLGSNYDGSQDSVWFLGQDGSANHITINSAGFVAIDASSMMQSDNFSNGGIYSDRPIAWLLIRQSPVTVP